MVSLTLLLPGHSVPFYRGKHCSQCNMFSSKDMIEFFNISVYIQISFSENMAYYKHSSTPFFLSQNYILKNVSFHKIQSWLFKHSIESHWTNKPYFIFPVTYQYIIRFYEFKHTYLKVPFRLIYYLYFFRVLIQSSNFYNGLLSLNVLQLFTVHLTWIFIFLWNPSLPLTVEAFQSSICWLSLYMSTVLDQLSS